MREASVGFQCPDCVAEGRRTTRTGRSTYGGAISSRPQLTSIVLIATNVAVWLAITVTGGAGSRLVDWFALRPDVLCRLGNGATGACPPGLEVPPAVADGAYWQLVTSGFTHVEVIHLAMNCFFIYMIGPQLEALLGRLRFLAVYATALLAGSVLVFLASDPSSLTLGASGAAYGLMGALLIVVIKRKLDARQLLILIGVNVVFTFAVAGISWQGHLGGFIGGALAAAILVYAPSGPTRSRWQWLGIAALVVVLAALTVAGSATLA